MDDDQIDLRHYLRILRRQLLLVVATVVAVTATALAVSLTETPLYAGELEMVIEPVRRTQDVTLDELLQREETIETERRIITSPSILAPVAAEVGADLEDLTEHVTTSVVPNSRVVLIRATDESPERAATIANAVAETYQSARQDEALATLVDARSSLEEQVESVRARIADVEQRLDEATTASEETVLEAERQSLVGTLGALVAQQSSLGGSTDLIGGARVISPATVDDEPVSPQPVRTGLLALVLGLMLGCGAAFVRDYLDDRVRSAADLDQAIGDRPILGRIPAWADDENQGLPTLITPRSPSAEAYATLATNLKYIALGGATEPGPGAPRGRVIAVTSAGPAEGKTSTATNLAVAAARAGRRALLLDLDLRRPALHARLNVPNGRGLSDAVLDTSQGLEPFVQPIGTLPLEVLPAGPVPPNPADVIASPAMEQLVSLARARADVVVIDTPPVLAVSDALEIAQLADAVVLVVRIDESHRRRVAAALGTLASVGANPAGIVLNAIEDDHDSYQYTYAYSADGDAHRRRWWRRLLPSRRGTTRPSTSSTDEVDHRAAPPPFPPSLLDEQPAPRPRGG